VINMTGSPIRASVSRKARLVVELVALFLGICALLSVAIASYSTVGGQLTEQLPSRAGSRTEGLDIPAGVFVFGGAIAALVASVVFMLSLKALIRELRSNSQSGTG
jgi:TRAP-type C4-dicarboxylate transport system permease small subunit